MKKLLAITALLFSASAFAQPTETTRESSGTKIVRDFLTPQQLATDSAFTWFAANQKDYTPYASTLQALRTKRDSVSFVVFGGTWCHDTQFILPKFLTLTGAAGVSPDRITLIGVDRAKKAPYNLSEAFHITNVPTILVMKNGVEIGRVVEYGKTGLFDKDLGEILAGGK